MDWFSGGQQGMEFVYLKNEVSYFVKYKTIGLFLFGVITYVD